MCGTNPDHKVLACKIDNAVKSWVLNRRTEVEIKWTLSIFGHWLIARLWYFQCVYQWDTNHGSYNVYDCWIWQNLVHVMAWCLRTTGHQTSCAPINTIDRGKKAVILQTTFSHAFSSITMCEFLSTFHRNLFSGVICIRKRKKLF